MVFKSTWNVAIELLASVASLQSRELVRVVSEVILEQVHLGSMPYGSVGQFQAYSPCIVNPFHVKVVLAGLSLGTFQLSYFVTSKYHNPWNIIT